MRFPKGRGKCRICGESKYRSGLCRIHYFDLQKEKYRLRSPEKEKRCVVCNKSFTTGRPFQKFCSPRCCQDDRNSKERNPKDCKSACCASCGTQFNRYSARERFCSRECRYKTGKIGSQYKLPMRLRSEVQADCEQCGVMFWHRPRSDGRKGRFCSLKCFYMANSGSESPIKRDGTFHCPSKKVWDGLCGVIRERDRQMCRACGLPPRGNHKHPVDHIVPRRQMFTWGIDPHQLFNLATLCRSCHGKKTFAENSILRGDFIGFISELKAINYPMDLVKEAFMQLGLPTQSI